MTEPKFLMKKACLKRGSERGASLLEVLFVITAAMLFALSVFAYYSYTSTQWSLTETQDDLSRAIRDVQDSYPSHIFRRVPSAELSQAIRDKSAPLGDIDASRIRSDPPDAFRVSLTMPSADQDASCPSLLQRMFQAPHIDSGGCSTRAGAAEMKLRVRRNQDAPLVGFIDIPDIYADIADCLNACNPANWRGPLPTREEMLVVRDTLETLSFIHSRVESCNTGNWDSFYQCASIEWRQGLYYIYSASGERYRIYTRYHTTPAQLEQRISEGRIARRDFPHLDPSQTETYPIAVALQIDESVYDILKDYHSFLQNGNPSEGYKGMYREARCSTRPACYVSTYVNPVYNLHPSLTPWWVNQDDD